MSLKRDIKYTAQVNSVYFGIVKSKKLSDIQLSKDLGVTISTIKKYRTGRCDIAIQFLLKLMEKYGYIMVVIEKAQRKRG